MIAVRLRFTALNAVLFLMPGIGLLALTTLLAGTRASAPVAGQVPAPPSLAGAQERIRLLEAQLTDIRTAQSRELIAGSPSAHERLAVPGGAADEVKDLADTVDGLLQRLETSFAALRRFAANASHELRTPLATMRTSLDIAPAKPEQVAKPAQPFQRLAADRTGTGSGLGSSIVAAAVEAHGGLRVTISLRS